jgi:dihydrofolate reductase
MQVVLFAAQSLDGWITRHATPGDAFTSEADKLHFRAAIRDCDACVMGRATYALSRERMRPQAFPGLRRVIWTRTPEAFASEAIPGVLEFTREPPSETVARLRADGRRRCAVLGGGHVNATWLAAGLVEELCITIESRLFGHGTSLAADGPPLDIGLSLLEARALAEGGPLLLRYTVKK